jgi:Cu(I)/Ag(I) efflux system membrane fusion protein
MDLPQRKALTVKTRLLSLAALALAVPALLLTGCKEKPAPGGGQAVKYTCSMHPDVVQDKPGKCPKCNMALVEKR